MMTALATVSAVKANATGYEVELSCDQQTSCSSCSSQKSCGTGVVSKAIGKKSLHWHLVTKKIVKEGQVVEIGLPEKEPATVSGYRVPYSVICAHRWRTVWTMVIVAMAWWR